MLAIIHRQHGEQDMANGCLARIHDLDATSAFVRYERAVDGQAGLSSLGELITNELAFETYLQLAIKYYNLGFPEESVEILKVAPKQAIVFLWLAFLDSENQQDWLKSGLDMSPGFVFPYRDETYAVLAHLMKTEDDWKLKYYASLICWEKDLVEQAKALSEQCGDQPDYVPFYLAKAELFADNIATKKAALKKARSLEEDNWRVSLALVEQSLADGEYEQAATLARNTLKEHPERPQLGVRYASALSNLGKYEECISFLESYEIIPFEGAIRGRVIYHEAAIKAALVGLHQRDFKSAIQLAEKASRWPRNLGSGKPYNPDERLENFIIAYCCEKLGRNSDAKTYDKKVLDYRLGDHQQENALLHLQVVALKKHGRHEEAESLIENTAKKDPTNLYVDWVRATENGEDAHAIAKEITKSDGQTLSTDKQFISLTRFLLLAELLKSIPQ